MRTLLILVTALTALTGCDSLNPGGLSTDDVDAIKTGDAIGVIYSGKWALETEVTESNCGGLLAFLPGKGDKDTEDITFAQSGGDLTRGIDEVGDNYSFNGSVNKDGSFKYGMYYDFSDGSIEVPLTYVEMVTGKFVMSGSKATMTGTSKRHYSSSLLDCSATVKITGERGALTGG